MSSEPRKLEQVDLGLNGILKHLHMTGEDSGWILCDSILYFANSISKKTYEQKATDVRSFAVSNEGEVYFVTNNRFKKQGRVITTVLSSVGERINIDGTITRWCDMAPYEPKHIFIRKPGEISVCLWSKDDKRYYLWRFNEMGGRLKQNDKTLGEDVNKVRENEFGELCVDSIIDSKRLSTFDENMSLSADFCGVLGANPSKTYSIADFCYVSEGRIVALDNRNGVIYLLDRKCSFIKLLTSVGEIESMQYVTLDRFDRLWISSWREFDHICTYVLSNWDE